MTEELLFKNGYCLEYAKALMDYYSENNIEVELGGVLNYIPEDDAEKDEIFEKSIYGNGIVEILDAFSMKEVEVSHYFVIHKNGLLEDVEGIKSFNDIIDNASFSQFYEGINNVSLVRFNDLSTAESFSCQIEEDIIEDAKLLIIIKKINELESKNELENKNNVKSKKLKY